MVEGARLESVYTARYRGFESHSLRSATLLQSFAERLIYMKIRHYVYIIRGEKDSSIYTGYTSDLNRRLNEHNKNKSAYTRNKGPWELIWFAAFDKKDKALDFESYLKQGSGFAFARKRFI